MGSTKTNMTLGTVEILHEGKEECEFLIVGNTCVIVALQIADMGISRR